MLRIWPATLRRSSYGWLTGRRRGCRCLSPGAAVCGILVVFAVFLWIITVASAPISFALTGALAIAWCAWLERHADASEVRRREAR